MTDTSQTNKDGTRTIFSRIHPDAIRRVSRFFDASISQAVCEILQNARRAGANLVTIETTTDGSLVITDNGMGIEDPQTLLDFGHTAWEQETAQREDAAGMGIYSLAKLNPIISSRRRQREGSAAGWRMQLDEANFVGNAPAVVEPRDDAPKPSGTSVAIEAQAWAKQEFARMRTGSDQKPSAQTPPETDENRRLKWGMVYQLVLEHATRHYPLDVLFNGRKMKRADILAQAVQVFEWNGLRIGVMSEAKDGGGIAPRINFHGRVVTMHVPCTSTLDDRAWWARIDVKDCGELELTLPARTSVVKTPFYRKALLEVHRCILTTMAAQPDMEVTSDVYQEAAELGIRMPEARKRLHPWLARNRDENRDDYERKRPVVEDNAVVLHQELEIADQQVLARALELSPDRLTVYEAGPQVRGYSWYKDLTRITALQIRITDNAGARRTLTEVRENHDTLPETVAAIDVVLTLTDPTKGTRTIELPVDIAVVTTNDRYTRLENVQVVMSNPKADSDTLATMLTNTYFNYDEEGESYATQAEDYFGEAFSYATELLDRKMAGLRTAILDLIERHVKHAVPKGQQISVVIRNESGRPKTTLDIEAV